MDAYLVLIGGGALSALVGLLGIAITKREAMSVLDQLNLNEDELKTYWNQRLITEGISWCTMGKHEFRPGPGASLTVCPECLPPAPQPGKWEAHSAPEHPVQRLNFGRAYRPLRWLYEEEEQRE